MQSCLTKDEIFEKGAYKFGYHHYQPDTYYPTSMQRAPTSTFTVDMIVLFCSCACLS